MTDAAAPPATCTHADYAWVDDKKKIVRCTSCGVRGTYTEGWADMDAFITWPQPDPLAGAREKVAAATNGQLHRLLSATVHEPSAAEREYRILLLEELARRVTKVQPNPGCKTCSGKGGISHYERGQSSFRLCACTAWPPSTP
jgi:hypothetical protein